MTSSSSAGSCSRRLQRKAPRSSRRSRQESDSSSIPSTSSARINRHNLTYRSTKRFDRQVRAPGPTGQARLRALRVAIVGLGGTGSQVVQQLAHLGVRSFVLIEDDRVEESNLPRLAGATWA